MVGLAGAELAEAHEELRDRGADERQQGRGTTTIIAFSTGRKRSRMPGLEAVVADEMAIRDLVSRYADAVNVVDAEAWGATWDDGGVWDLGGQRIEGRPQIVEFWRTAMGGFEAVIQLVAHGSVTVEGDHATGRWTLWELGRREGAGTLVVGCYVDRYRRAADGWRFAERRFTVTYRGTSPEGSFSAFPELADQPSSGRSKTNGGAA